MSSLGSSSPSEKPEGVISREEPSEDREELEEQEQQQEEVPETAETMGVGSSTCKGFMYPASEESDKELPPRSLSTVTRLPFLSAFEDRAPFQTSDNLCERDLSLLKALTHHRTPFAVVETRESDTRIAYASGGCVAGMGMPVESIEGTSLGTVLKKGIQASQADVDRLEAAIRAQQVRVGQSIPVIIPELPRVSSHMGRTILASITLIY